MNDSRLVPCEGCGSEGYRRYVATVYEHGCGYGHDDVFLDYSQPCTYCDGAGMALIETDPIDEDDLIAMGGSL